MYLYDQHSECLQEDTHRRNGTWHSNARRVIQGHVRFASHAWLLINLLGAKGHMHFADQHTGIVIIWLAASRDRQAKHMHANIPAASGRATASACMQSRKLCKSQMRHWEHQKDTSTVTVHYVQRHAGDTLVPSLWACQDQFGASMR